MCADESVSAPDIEDVGVNKDVRRVQGHPGCSHSIGPRLGTIAYREGDDVHEVLLDALTDAAPEVRSVAIVGLNFRWFDEPPLDEQRAVTLMTAQLQHPNELARAMAAGALARLGPGAEPALTELIQALDDNYPLLRMTCRSSWP